MINKNDMLSKVKYCTILAEKIQLNYFFFTKYFLKNSWVLNTEIYKVFSTSTFCQKKVFKVKYLVKKYLVMATLFCSQ